MFCGFPVIVATLPILAAIATASRYGIGLRSSRSAILATSGVMTRQIASFSRKAENKPEVSVTVASSANGCRARYRPAGDEAKESRQPQIADYDHHAEEKRDCVEINDAGDIVDTNPADRQHETCADQ